MRKLEVSLVACLITIVILATSTFYLYDLNIRQENPLVVENETGNLEETILSLESQLNDLEDEIADLESQVDYAYAEGYDVGYIQGINDGVGVGYNIRDPTNQEMLEFITLDQTDKNEYDEDSYHCFHFVADVEKNAFEIGYRCGLVYIEFPDSAHSIVAFNTIDHGLIYIEPQNDEIVTLIIGKLYWDRTKYDPLYDDTIISFMIVW